MKFLILVLICLAFYACTPKNKLEMISVAENRCGTSCNGSATEIKSSLEYHYYGGYNSTLQGYYEGRVDENAWKDIADQLEKIDIDTLKSDYSVGLDEWFAEIVIHQGGKVKRIVGDTHLPKTLSPVILRILKSYKTINLRKSNYKYPFETTFQKPANFGPPKFPPKPPE
jgi:hypothetical protein